MVNTRQYRPFAKIAPDPQRQSQQVRVRFDPRDPTAEPILVMLERTAFGETRTVVAQALRIGAAVKLGEALPPDRQLARRQAALGRRDRLERSPFSRQPLAALAAALRLGGQTGAVRRRR